MLIIQPTRKTKRLKTRITIIGHLTPNIVIHPLDYIAGFRINGQTWTLFTRVVSTLEQLNLNIAQSRLVSMDDGYDLHTLHVLGPDNKIITDPEDQKHIINVMQRNLTAKSFTPAARRQTRILRNFDIRTRIHFRQLPDRNLTLMEVNTGDMPGLLWRIGETLDGLDIKVHHAQISTLGEQAEDTFAITTRGEEMITDEVDQEAIRVALTEAVKV